MLKQVVQVKQDNNALVCMDNDTVSMCAPYNILLTSLLPTFTLGLSSVVRHVGTELQY